MAAIKEALDHYEGEGGGAHTHEARQNEEQRGEEFDHEPSLTNRGGSGSECCRDHREPHVCGHILHSQTHAQDFEQTHHWEQRG